MAAGKCGGTAISVVAPAAADASSAIAVAVDASVLEDISAAFANDSNEGNTAFAESGAFTLNGSSRVFIAIAAAGSAFGCAAAGAVVAFAVAAT